MTAPEALKVVHPLGKAPVLTDDGKVLAETAVIIEYLAEKHPDAGLLPSIGAPGYWPCRYFLHYAEGSLMPNLGQKLLFDFVENAKMPFFARPIARAIAGNVKRRRILPELALHRAFIEAHLARSPWFAGDVFSAADVAMYYPLLALQSRFGLDESPFIAAFLARVQQRPAYVKALEKAGGFGTV